ncbi:MAG: putative lipoprotein [Bacteroidetes bacterium]|nr:MAG: putative lipoprotein [Bacteroidota bacterium]
MQRVYTFLVLLLAVSAVSCGEFEKLKKHGTFDAKYAKALEYYEKKEYVRAQQLFEDLSSSVNVGSEQGQTILYYQAMTNYQLNDYIMAGYQFRNYFRRYPLSEKAEECAYMSAYCHFLNSPPYSLDQTDSRDAITEFTFFVKQFPNSKYVPECNKMIDKLYEKLERKSYEIAKQYYRTEDYKASIAAFQNLFREFPDSKHREEGNFLIVKCNYLLTVNSVAAKADERVKTTLEACNKFKSAFRDSRYEQDVDELYKSTMKIKERLDRDKKANN